MPRPKRTLALVLASLLLLLTACLAAGPSPAQNPKENYERHSDTLPKDGVTPALAHPGQPIVAVTALC